MHILGQFHLKNVGDGITLNILDPWILNYIASSHFDFVGAHPVSPPNVEMSFCCPPFPDFHMVMSLILMVMVPLVMQSLLLDVLHKPNMLRLRKITCCCFQSDTTSNMGEERFAHANTIAGGQFWSGTRH